MCERAVGDRRDTDVERGSVDVKRERRRRRRRRQR